MKWEIEGKDIIAWLISLIPLLIFYLDNKKDKEKQDKRINKLIEKVNNLSEQLLRAVKNQKDLEIKLEKENSEKWKENYLEEKSLKDHYYKSFWNEEEKNRKSEKDKEKLKNIESQLTYLLMWRGGYKESKTLIKEDIGIDEWNNLPETINKKEEIENWEREKQEENDNLREQLREHGQREYRYKNDSEIYCGIPDDEQNINDSTRRKEAIEEIERYLSSLLYAYKKKRINFKITEKILPKSWKIDFENKSEEEIIEWRDRLIKIIDDEKAKENKKFLE